MAKDERGADPHVGLSFWVEIDGVEIAGFSECSGLSVETEMMEYNEGGWNLYVHKFPTRVKYSNVTLRRGLNEGAELFEWFKKGIAGKAAPRHNVCINLYSPSGRKVRSWALLQAYPVKWTGPDMKTDSGAVTVESLELSYKGFQALPTRDGKESSSVN